ncbi:MAG: glycosyltransferase [Vicinamibacterales bacterium]|nr:glycosyltransferase [Vicinamibacterales bacterium]
MVRRALLISPHFPPDSTAATHRVRVLAPYLEQFGWVPTVLTVEAGACEGALDPDLLALVPDTLSVVRARAWRAGVTRRFGVGDLGLRSMAGLWRHASALLSTGRFDVFFITIHPTYTALLGPGLRARYGVPFVLDYQDPWVGAWGRTVGTGREGQPDIRSRLTRALGAWLEPRAVRAADGVTAVSARTYEDVLARVPDAHPIVRAALPLGFDEADVDYLRRHPRPVRHFDPFDGNVHVCYVGTILPEGQRVLRLFLAAVAWLLQHRPAVAARLRLHFIGTSNQRVAGQPPRVLPMARAFGVSHLVTEVPERVDYLDALNAQFQAHGVALLGSTEPHYTPSKAYPALASGRPLLALYHEASSVVPLLAACPRAEVLTFVEDFQEESLAPQVGLALGRMVERPPAAPVQAAAAGHAPWSARTIAGELAGVFDAVSKGRA